jgi:cob(I)alamin adenosyltransferase
MSFKIYTKTGDKGETSLFGGKRLPKSHLRIEAYGTVDELNAFMGLLRDATEEDEAVRDWIKEIQDLLFSLGAALAMEPGQAPVIPGVEESHIEVLEQRMDAMDETLPPLKNFILPGGHPTVSFCHIARCVCRRAERLVVALALEEEVDERIVRYLNRLSDFLFMLARKLSRDLGAEEILWAPAKTSGT